MYLDTDILLAILKADDWLESAVDEANFEKPKTSVVTAVEIQLVMFDTWTRSRLGLVHDEIGAEGIEILPLTPESLQSGTELFTKYPSLNIFDALHVGHARTLKEPLVSTDTLYPRIDEIDHLDPREL